MFTFNLDDHSVKSVHFIGMGGVSMSGIALLLLNHGFHISGSDRSPSDITDKIVEQGGTFYEGQRASNINNPDLVVYTDAIAPDNEELIAAKNTGVPVVTRGVFLGALMRNFVHSIAVSGSHGKSTTTSMISQILVHSPHDPTILLGGSLDEIGGNVYVGERDYLVTEACEFKANILHYYPSLAIILNIDEDHLDFYKNLDHIVDTFIGYIKNLDENSKAVINIDDENCLPLLDHIRGKGITFGMLNEKADYLIGDIQLNNIGYPSFSIRFPDGHKETFQINVMGRFNLYNATAAIIACYESGVDIETIRTNLASYKGLHRRMEVIGTVKGATIMTDYGHHPVELVGTLGALSEFKKARLICAFQPHTYSRTKTLMDGFSKAFFDADEVIVTDIFAAREKFDPTIHSKDLVEKLVANGVDAKYFPDFPEAKEYLTSIAEKGDIIITSGCGDPHRLAYMIVEDGNA